MNREKQYNGGAKRKGINLRHSQAPPHNQCSGSQQGPFCPPPLEDIWQRWRHFQVMTGSTTGIWWVGSVDAAQSPAGSSTAPHNKELFSSNCRLHCCEETLN